MLHCNEHAIEAITVFGRFKRGETQRQYMCGSELIKYYAEKRFNLA